jgi:hypothetical protein
VEKAALVSKLAVSFHQPVPTYWGGGCHFVVIPPWHRFVVEKCTGRWVGRVTESMRKIS